MWFWNWCGRILEDDLIEYLDKCSVNDPKYIPKICKATECATVGNRHDSENLKQLLRHIQHSTVPVYEYEWFFIAKVCLNYGSNTQQDAWNILFAILHRACSTGDLHQHNMIVSHICTAFSWDKRQIDFTAVISFLELNPNIKVPPSFLCSLGTQWVTPPTLKQIDSLFGILGRLSSTREVHSPMHHISLSDTILTRLASHVFSTKLDWEKWFCKCIGYLQTTSSIETWNAVLSMGYTTYDKDVIASNISSIPTLIPAHIHSRNIPSWHQSTIDHLYGIINDIASQLRPFQGLQGGGSAPALRASTEPPTHEGRSAECVGSGPTLWSGAEKPRQKQMFMEEQMKHFRQTQRNQTLTEVEQRFECAVSIAQCFVSKVWLHTHFHVPPLHSTIQLRIWSLSSYDENCLFALVDEATVQKTWWSILETNLGELLSR